MPQRKKKIQTVINFSEYFRHAKENFQDIYVQNVSNTQISMQVPVGHDQIEAIKIPRTRRPYNLCQDAPFDALANCMDLRKLVSRRPEVLKLIKEADYVKYYDRLSAKNNTSVDEEIDKALELKRTLVMRKPESGPRPKSLDELALEKEAEMVEEIPITPRIAGMCAQVGQGIKEADMMRAIDIIEELNEMEEDLTRHDLEYLLQNGYWKTVKSWANKALSKLPEEEEE